jgi:hypothetical protein
MGAATGDELLEGAPAPGDAAVCALADAAASGRAKAKMAHEYSDRPITKFPPPARGSLDEGTAMKDSALPDEILLKLGSYSRF